MVKRRSAAQRAHDNNLSKLGNPRKTSNVSLSTVRSLKTRGQVVKQNLEGEISQREAEIDNLKARTRECEAQLLSCAREITQKDATILDLQRTLANSGALAQRLGEESRAKDAELAEISEDLRKSRKRIQRLAHERDLAKEKYLSDVQKLKDDARQQSQCSKSYALALSSDRIRKLEDTVIYEKGINDELRKKAHRFEMQASRAQKSLKTVRAVVKSKSTWSAKKGGVYTAQARRLARELLKAGCSSERVGDAMLACAKAFGIKVREKMSGRTVLRARDEGGFYGLMQLGREITQAPGFGESSDGTAHRKITYEAHHATLSVPSYEPGVDDSDTSTWSNRIRFIEVEPALDHTAKTQFEGTKHLASRIATAYSGSPLSERDGTKMETNDWVRKEEFQSMDHAADGKKKFSLTEEWKEEVICEDLGEKAMEDMDADKILSAMRTISQDDVDAARAKLDPADRDSAAIKLLERALGKTVLDALEEDERKSLVAMLFAGCCGHKDLNAFKYGVQRMMATWDLKGRPPPLLLANKANDAVIRLGEEADSAAVQRAVDSSSRGGVKLASLAGALFNHKSEEQGYQDVHRMFIAKQKKEIHGIMRDKKFPDTSNTRYQSHSYAAAELITFLDLYIDLLEVSRDSKKQAGFNHLEQNVAKGLEDASTLAEMAAMALYGNSVSWPYLNRVRGGGGTIVNLLDLGIIALHRRLPDFCDHIAANPRLQLDTVVDKDFSKITIDGKPWMNKMLIMSIQILASELPDLELMISAMFSGCADGWRRFTTEFFPGGPIDQLTAEQLSRMFIPATNDPNEGALGSWRVNARFHPNGSAYGFSNQTRTERNNTEMFIDKHCNLEDQLYVMRQVRIENASRAKAAFREHLLKSQRERASATRTKQQAADAKKRAEIARLTTVGLIVDRVKISKMTVPQLNDQLSIYRKFLNDEVLLKVPQKDIKSKVFKLTAVLAAVTRNEEKIGALRILIENMQESGPNSGDLEESVENSSLDDEDQEDIDKEDEEDYEQAFY